MATWGSGSPTPLFRDQFDLNGTIPSASASQSVRLASWLLSCLHSGVFVGPQDAAFAGITHGQKVHDFIEKLLMLTVGVPIPARIDRTDEDLPRSPQAALRRTPGPG